MCCAVLYLVAQSYPTLCDLMDCSSPGSLCPWDSPGKNTLVGCCALLQGIFPTQESTQVSCIVGGFFIVWATREAYSSVQFSLSVVSDSLQPHGLQHARLLCPSPTPGVYSNSCPLSRWCHPTISSFVIPFSFCLQSFPAPRSFPISQFFIAGSQSIGASVSAPVLPLHIQDWFPLLETDWFDLSLVPS